MCKACSVNAEQPNLSEGQPEPLWGLGGGERMFNVSVKSVHLFGEQSETTAEFVSRWEKGPKRERARVSQAGRCICGEVSYR